MKKQVIIIGGGASGMTAAIFAARNGAKVIILEHMDRIGKKILSTGNGKCNLTNQVQKPECYRGEHPEFAMQVLEGFSFADTIKFFGELGVYTKNRNGYLYPNSEQASAVLDVLRMELAKLQVEIRCGIEIEEIKKDKEFQIKTKEGIYSGGALILAAGSKAAPATGSDGSGYKLAETFGHHIVPPVPALVQLKCPEKFFKGLAGIRCDAEISLHCGGKKLKQTERGELQLTNYGISGIPVFQLSRFAAKALLYRQEVFTEIDFMPDFEREVLKAFLKKRKQENLHKTAEQYFIGLLNKKLVAVLLKESGIKQDQMLTQIGEKQWEQLIDNLKSFRVSVTDTNSFLQAQVCAGGVDTTEINPATMESKIVPGLYIVGELLDIDGICGGYNLQFAWSSGAVAGKCEKHF